MSWANESLVDSYTVEVCSDAGMATNLQTIDPANTPQAVAQALAYGVSVYYTVTAKVGAETYASTVKEVVLVAVADAKVGEWTFSNSSDITEAEVGSALTVIDPNSLVTSGGGTIVLKNQAHLKVPHGLTDGSRYTVVMDISAPDMSGYSALLEKDQAGDGDIFIKDGRVGNTGYGSATQMAANSLYRVYMAFDSGTMKIYIYDETGDGLGADGAFLTNTRTGGFDLATEGEGVAYIGEDGSNGGEEKELHLSKLTIYNRALLADEIATQALGGMTPVIGLEVNKTDTEISWTVESETGVKEYRVVDSASSEVIATVTADGTLSYSVALPEGANDIVLDVIDYSGYTQTYTANTETELVLNLTKGWNLISLPFACEDVSILTGIAWKWNNTTQSYETVEVVDAQQGFWLYGSEEKEVSVIGEPLNTGIDLLPGWNLVGPAFNVEAPADLLIYGWDAGYQQTGVMSRGKGYWVHSLDERIFESR